MTATATKTAGQELTAELRRYFSVGPRTRRYRNGDDLHDKMIEALGLATQYPGYYAEQTNRIFGAAWSVYCAYGKHVGGYRIDPMVRLQITRMSPWRFAALLGEMVDAGVTNNFEGERFFREMAKEVNG